MNRKRIIIILSVIVLCVIALILFVFLKFNTSSENTKIIAIKVYTQENDAQNKTIKYEIQIKNYDIEGVKETIKFDSEEDARLVYEQYEIMNEFEQKEIDVNIKKKNIIVNLTKEQFIEEVNYPNKKLIIIDMPDEKQQQIISQKELKEYLIEQGYTIK